jgi:hypothetical protein
MLMVASSFNLNETKSIGELSKNLDTYYKTKLSDNTEITLSPCKIAS